MKKIFIYSLIAVALFSGANFSYADNINEYTLLEPLPCIEGTGNNCKEGETIPKMSLDGYVGYIFKLAIALAVFLATVVLIYGGFEYMLSEAFNTKSAAKTRMTNAILGLLGALASYLILATIDPRLVQINTRIPEVKINIEADVLGFQGKLEADLKKLTVEHRAEVARLENKINSTTKETAELDAKQNKTPEEIKRLEVLRQERRNDRAEQIKIITAGSAQVYFRNTFEELRRREAYDKNGIINSGGYEYIKTAKEKIEKIYEDSVKNYNLSGDPGIMQSLANQKAFYLDQISEENKFMGKIVRYSHKDTILTQSLRESWNVYYEKYTRDLAALQRGGKASEILVKIKDEPDLLKQYTTILTDRLNLLKKVQEAKEAELK